ncbi:FolD bifunctional protein [Methylenetetrahydrofolate dehydrogenase; Methenyltetrahydrofolate cyclohydrolase] [Ehrlichia ruminantium str. Gardel]|uniref:Bifunctional protein FolD n=1 Tax=Ehrlichia ruminantium (strain Gardel) TaxID=302409 RepID=FOLD_EHRRG|nr:bifunctional methylenetetrahydrofolate dehydrogenase/methenyltetrahydrofolate cyclohydrolase FolD [Ehrlichia ruminantium]Q5FG00.1 RecName: Full=Bifunctional protein FolD; Includes: RecName: Full=Methylenetetrahydrofolate dehydrogenase; Includes: RecName: Full=Methenyltetrahydrofolate cyclohydrolase [Ehrlichia ruminantium str. Gardel]CAI28150.1 FolD bifunctional protein [Methylenetetrahydrofolate dehydrogenase; Methenyltetrahydrofolate cyclohydrolase] [Ehrlichia ruminantium str. Gardel]
MEGNIVSGKAVADNITNILATCISDLKVQHNLTPCLIVVLVGDDPASQLYVRNKQRKAEMLGLRSETMLLPSTISESSLIEKIHQLNNDDSVHGILVQLPVPRHIDKNLIINTIDPKKDVDGFHNENVGRLFTGQKKNCLVPCTPQGCLYLIKTITRNLSGSDAVVIGRSNIVGKPMACLLLGENCTVTTVHSATRDLPDYCRRADILVAAVGIPRFVKYSWVKHGAIVIDVGINSIEEDGVKKFVGDVDFAEVNKIASAITPVPGGVGPMTIAFLMVNTIIAACNQSGIHGFLEKYLDL